MYYQIKRLVHHKMSYDKVCIKVKLNAAATTNFTDQIIAVEGILKINPWEGPDGNTWSVYDLDGLSVTNNTRL